MKNIQFKTPGAMLERSPDGKMVRKSFDAIVELPFSEENLRQAESKALPGSMQILSREDHNALHDNQGVDALQRICLTDRATGNSFELYIENGQLMKEVL